MRLAAALAIVGAGFLIWPGVSPAAIVERGDFATDVYVTALPGETNDLEISSTSSVDSTTIVVTENGVAPLLAGQGCVADGSSVTCEAEALTFVRADLSDGDDKLDGSGYGERQMTAVLGDGDDQMLTNPRDACADGGAGEDRIEVVGDDAETCTVAGGPGDDTLVGSNGPDSLEGDEGTDLVAGMGGNDAVSGGSGDDKLTGGPGVDDLHTGAGNDDAWGGLDRDIFREAVGNDRLLGGGGNDHYEGIADGRDLLIGGQGRDALRIVCKSCRISFDGRANDGVPGEKDNIDVEEARVDSTGYRENGSIIEIGSGRDRLVGDGGPNTLAGRRGDDRIIGKGGRDRLSGGEDEDEIDARDGERDIVSCGAGRDVVFADPVDRIRGCETIR